MYHRATYIRSNIPISIESLRAFCPSAFAEKPWERTSKKYSFLPSSQVIEKLYASGLACFAVKQAGTRIDGKENFTKHSLRFRSVNSTPLIAVGDTFLEHILTNSHDTTSSYSLEMGLYRLACSNGMVVSAGLLSRYKIRHIHNTIQDVVVALDKLADNTPAVVKQLETMQARVLTDSERLQFAERAMALRYDVTAQPYAATRLLEARRFADKGDNLFSVLNRVQENLTQGQYRSTRLERTSRKVRNIDLDLQLNRGLWQLASSLV